MEYIKKFKSPFIYAANCEAHWKRVLEEISGYNPFTTFYYDFSIGEFCSGKDGIIDTFNRAFKEWKTDVKYFTELVMVLNHKAWEMSTRENDEWCELYCELYEKAHDEGFNLFKDDELSYYISTLD